jgi:hypothetical protein
MNTAAATERKAQKLVNSISAFLILFAIYLLMTQKEKFHIPLHSLWI